MSPVAQPLGHEVLDDHLLDEEADEEAGETHDHDDDPEFHEGRDDELQGDVYPRDVREGDDTADSGHDQQGQGELPVGPKALAIRGALREHDGQDDVLEHANAEHCVVLQARVIDGFLWLERFPERVSAD